MQIYKPDPHCLITLLHFLVLVSLMGTARGEPCRQWGEAKAVGILDSSRLGEASGVAASWTYADRLYHVNDSGPNPGFFITDLYGKIARAVAVDGFGSTQPDVEDISMGPCPDGCQCLFIADIGDNKQSRKQVEILVIQEQQEFPDTVEPVRRIELAYPDGPHNAEAIAVHPDGTIYLLTKALSEDWEQGVLERWFGRQRQVHALPARLYKLEPNRWESNASVKHSLEFAGEIDLPALIEPRSPWPLGQLATGMSIAPDGGRLLVLTYSFVLEFNIDLSDTALFSGKRLAEGRDYRFIDARRLPYQESITYLSGGKSFIYHTEQYRAPQEMMRVDCVE